MVRKFFVLLLFLVILLGVAAFFSASPKKTAVHFFDVGQGDAIYIRTKENFDILIDGGPSSAILSKLGEQMPFYDRTIDIVIITHPHADHITGLIEVLKQYTVKRVYLTGALHTTPEYLTLLDALRKNSAQKIKVDHRFVAVLSGETRLEFLYPDFDVSSLPSREKHPFIADSLNNTSIVVRFVSSDMSVLFTGDIEEEAEHYVTARYRESGALAARILKVAHQGSKTSSSESFLDMVLPEIAVITAGVDNQYGHPHDIIVNRLKRYAQVILRTDEEGDIILKEKSTTVRKEQ